MSGIDIEVTADYPLVSMASRLIPSPDWFFGLEAYQHLCLEGRWLDEIPPSIYITRAMNAGTDVKDTSSAVNEVVYLFWVT